MSLSVDLLKYDEVPQLVDHARSFYQEMKLPGQVKSDVMIRNWQQLISIGAGFVVGLFDDKGSFQGGLGATMTPNLCDGVMVASECFWYVAPEYRSGRHALRLIRYFENEARRRGSGRVSMIHLERSNGDTLAALYQRLGYSPLETHWIKEL